MAININEITTVAEADRALTLAVLSLQANDRIMQSVASEVRALIDKVGADTPVSDLIEVTLVGSLPYSAQQNVTKRMKQTLGQDIVGRISHLGLVRGLLSSTVIKDPDERIVPVGTSPEAMLTAEVMRRTQGVMAQRNILGADWASVARRYGQLVQGSDLKNMDGMYVSVSSRRRDAQGWMKTSGRNKHSFTVVTDQMEHGLMPYNALPWGRATLQSQLTVQTMYRVLVQQFGERREFSIPKPQEMKFNVDNDMWVLLPRAASQARRAAIPQYVAALLDVRAEAMKEIDVASAWEAANGSLLMKQRKFNAIVSDSTPENWAWGTATSTRLAGPAGRLSRRA